MPNHRNINLETALHEARNATELAVQLGLEAIDIFAAKHGALDSQCVRHAGFALTIARDKAAEALEAYLASGRNA